MAPPGVVQGGLPLGAEMANNFPGQNNSNQMYPNMGNIPPQPPTQALQPLL